MNRTRRMVVGSLSTLTVCTLLGGGNVLLADAMESKPKRATKRAEPSEQTVNFTLDSTPIPLWI